MPTQADTTRLARALLAPEDRGILDHGRSGPGVLSGPEPQQGLPPLLANADPKEDADWLLEYMRPPIPASPWIEPQAVEQQNWQDPPLWRYKLPEPPKEKSIPPRDQW